MDSFHFPPELLQLLIDAIPLLCPRKADVLLFFQGAGVDEGDLREFRDLLAVDRDGFKKHTATRAILARLNEGGDSSLRQRREVLKRVCEFENFSTCWPDDQLKAEGLVAAIRKVVNVKDSFTRMKQEKDREQAERRRAHDELAETMRRKREELAALRRDLCNLFGVDDAWVRGKALEGVLNRLFKAAGIGIREAFVVKGDQREGIVEQIDGAVELEGHLYLVEVKWHKDPIGVGEVSQHLVRLHSRSGARGVYISASGFSLPAVAICRDNLSLLTIVLCELSEIVALLEEERSVADLLRAKVVAAIADKNPLHRWQG